MLSKEICRQCCNKQSRFKWDCYDETNWEEDKVICCPVHLIKKRDSLRTEINDAPPDGCPYILEHIVSETVKC